MDFFKIHQSPILVAIVTVGSIVCLFTIVWRKKNNQCTSTAIERQPLLNREYIGITDPSDQLHQPRSRVAEVPYTSLNDLQTNGYVRVSSEGEFRFRDLVGDWTRFGGDTSAPASTPAPNSVVQIDPTNLDTQLDTGGMISPLFTGNVGSTNPIIQSAHTPYSWTPTSSTDTMELVIEVTSFPTTDIPVNQMGITSDLLVRQPDFIQRDILDAHARAMRVSQAARMRRIETGVHFRGEFDPDTRLDLFAPPLYNWMTSAPAPAPASAPSEVRRLLKAKEIQYPYNHPYNHPINFILTTDSNIEYKKFLEGLYTIGENIDQSTNSLRRYLSDTNIDLRKYGIINIQYF